MNNFTNAKTFLNTSYLSWKLDKKQQLILELLTFFVSLKGWKHNNELNNWLQFNNFNKLTLLKTKSGKISIFEKYFSFRIWFDVPFLNISEVNFCIKYFKFRNFDIYFLNRAWSYDEIFSSIFSLLKSSSKKLMFTLMTFENPDKLNLILQLNISLVAVNCPNCHWKFSLFHFWHLQLRVKTPNIFLLLKIRKL